MKLLVVEDEIKLAEYLRKGLTEEGFVVDVAHNGVDGLHLAMEFDYELIVLDGMLPGIDGLSLARQIRAMGKRLPLLAVTARSDAQAEGEVCQAGFDAYVRKPVTGVLLAEALVGMLREQDPATAKELA